MNRLRKCIFPVAGLGTRFLPATKASPKEMLPVVDKPLIQYAVEEAVAAGFTEMIFITGRNKRSIEDHFDKAYELETELVAKEKFLLLEAVQSILPAHVSCIYTRQAEALGLGHAVLCADAVVGNEAFAVILADDLIDAQPNVLQQMMEKYHQTGESVIGVQRILPSETAAYGVVAVDEQHCIRQIVEKPQPEDAPSDLGVVGRYILTPRIFDLLKTTGRGAGNEIQLTDALADLLAFETIHALPFQGRRFDCGSKLGYLQATVEFALKHPEVGVEFAHFLAHRSQR